MTDGLAADTAAVKYGCAKIPVRVAPGFARLPTRDSRAATIRTQCRNGAPSGLTHKFGTCVSGPERRSRRHRSSTGCL